MSWINYDDVLAQMRSGGLLIDGINVGTSKPVRCRVDGEDREKRGWYWLNEILLPNADGQREPYLTGAWGVYHGNDDGKRKIEIRRDGKARKLSAEERDAIAARQRENAARMKARRDGEIERAASQATRAWRKYVDHGDSDYLRRKGVAAHGLRYAPSGNGTVAVPMMDPTGRIWGLQIIRGKDRGNKLEKQYWPAGLAKTGHYHLLGPLPTGCILIAEGYATAATLHEATGLPVACAFDAGNLHPVAEAIRKFYRGVKILLCADDDYRTPGNPGISAAQLAAHAVGGSWIAPVFADQRPDDRKGPTDFNDLQALEGQAAVRAKVETRLRELGWLEKVSRPRGDQPEGGGEREAMPSILQIEDAIDRYALIYGGKGTFFDAVEHMLVPKQDVLDILPEHGWRDMRARKRVVRIDEVGFDPGGLDPRVTCNLWGGWPTTPRQGACGVLLDLLLYLCGHEKNAREIYDWVLKWLAYPIQHPGAKMRTALVFHGPQGAGKNLFFEAVMAIYGEYGRIVDQSAIEDKFNDWASRKLFLIADEVVARQELFHVKNKLKGFVTGEWIRINPKNVAAHDERNHVNLVFLSNETQPLVLEKDDRRYTVIWTPEKLDPSFYADVRDELRAGGVAALHHHLLNLQLGEFDEHTKPPLTQAKSDLIDLSLGSPERFVKDWQAGDVHIGAEPLPFCPCGSADLYAAYLLWCRGEGIAKPREQAQFLGTLAKLPRWQREHKSRYETTHYTGTPVRQRMVLPSPDAQEAAAKQGHDWRQPAAKTLTQWLTDCFFAVRGVLDGRP